MGKKIVQSLHWLETSLPVVLAILTHENQAGIATIVAVALINLSIYSCE